MAARADGLAESWMKVVHGERGPERIARCSNTFQSRFYTSCFTGFVVKLDMVKLSLHCTYLLWSYGC